MGCLFSKRPRTPPTINIDASVAAPPAAATITTTNNIEYTAELSSYEAACRIDPQLQTFDTTLRQRTSRVFSTLALGVEVRSLTFDSLQEVTGCFLDMNKEVVKIILECRKDIWDNPELFGLVEDYFDNSAQTLDFYTALEKCLKKARDRQLIISLALQRFEEEESEGSMEEDGKKKYDRISEELKHFKAAGNPFNEEFSKVFQSVYRQQVLMLEKLQQRKNKLGQKQKSVKAWRKVSNIIFVSAFAAVLICSVVAAAMAAPPVAAALAAATTIPLGSMGRWIDSLWKKYSDALKGQKEVISLMHLGTFVAIQDLDSIRVLVDRLEIQLDSLLQNADFALRDEEAVKFGVEEIKKKLGVFMKSIEVLGVQADRCITDIRQARTAVLNRISRDPN